MRQGPSRVVVETFMIRTPDYLRDLKLYVPGKPIAETKRQFKLKKVIKLASNENALGASTQALRALQKAKKNLFRYPDPAMFTLREAIAKSQGIQPNQILFGNGSDECIQIIVRAVCFGNAKILFPKYSFIAYRVCAQSQGTEVVETEVNEKLEPNLLDIEKQLKRDPSIKAVFLANPNNPTGVLIGRKMLLEFLDRIFALRDDFIFVLDYAYYEYLEGTKEAVSPQELLKKYPNLIVLRTFSKIYGLAGLRLGYAVGSPQLIGEISKLKQPFNNGILCEPVGLAAFKDQKFVERSRKMNEQGMTFWKKFLKRHGIPYVESHGNFLLIETTPFKMSGGQLFEMCLTRGLILRPVGNYGLDNHIRISVGSPSDNRFAVKVLKNYLEHAK